MSEHLSLLPDYSRPTPAMQERLESLLDGAGVSLRWMPHRLVVLNWWQWDYQEFHFGRGWQMFRGQNAAGKSLMLVTVVPFLLDGDRRRYRVDTAGSDARTISYYLLGAPEATPESDFYYDERVGYAALEFIHPATREIRTVGVGLHGRRVGDTQADVDFWGFVLRDGRRVGDGISFVDAATGAPLSRDAFAAQLGANPFADTATKYQEAVNDALFGFASLDEFRRAMDITLQLRRPNLHSSMTPQMMCQHLSESLPELDEHVLSQMAGTLEDIDRTRKSIRETEEHLEAARRVDLAVGNYLNQLAQQRAVALLDAETRRGTEVSRLETLQAEHGEATAARAAAQQKQTEIETEVAAASARRTTLEQNEAFVDRARLESLDADLTRARGQVQRENRNVAQHEGAIVRAEGRVARNRHEWSTHTERQREHVDRLREQAGAAAWEYAEGFAEAAETLLAKLSGPEVDVSSNVSAATLETLGDDRMTALRSAEFARSEVDAAEAAFGVAHERLEDANLALSSADEERVHADRAMSAARTDAAAAVNSRLEASRHVRLPRSVREVVLDRIHLYDDHAGDPFTVLDPVREVVDGLLRAQEELRGQAVVRRRDLTSRLERLTDELQELESREWAVPQPRPGQEEVRAALQRAGARIAPFYTCVNLRAETDPELGASLEAALTGAGLLDSLMVASADCDTLQDVLRRVAGDICGGDAWLDPLATPAAGATLFDILEPAECPVPKQDIERTLRAIATDSLGVMVSQVGRDGSWRLGVAGGWSGAGELRAPQYIGESNRRRLLQERIQRVQEDMLEVEIALEDVEKELDSIARTMAEVREDVDALLKLEPVAALRIAAGALAGALADVGRRNEAVIRVTGEVDEKRKRLLAKRLDLESALRDIPEARNLSVAAIEDLIRATRDCLTTARILSGDMKRFADIRDSFAAAVEDARTARNELEQAKLFLVEAIRDETAIKSQRDALQERLEGLGLEALVAEIERLRRKIGVLASEREELLKRSERAATRIEAIDKEIEAALPTVAAAVSEYRSAEAELATAIQVYPAESLLSARKIAEDPEHGLLAAAEHLLRFRRAERDRLANVISADVEAATRALATAFAETKGLLAEYSPEMDDAGRVRYRLRRGASSNPKGLADDLAERQEQNRQAIREKEDALYEEFFLNELSSSIRERIEQAKALAKGINRLLRQKRFVNGELGFSVKWKPREDKGGDYRKLVELLETDLVILPEEKLSWVKEFFRKRIAEVRAAEEQKTLETTYEVALREVLDYREWFRFHVYSTEGGAHDVIDDESGTNGDREGREQRYELTGTRFKRGSGAQKALGVFCPLVAAAYVRFAAAAPDAPRLIGMDEAFGGVDAPNMNEMIRFLVELEFSVVMTSETRWGVASALPACTTYDLQSLGGVAAARMWLWDGFTRQADHSLELVDLRPRRVAHASAG